MPTTVQVQTSFTTGEISPKALGRSDLKRFFIALAECENMILPKQGGAERRTGTRFVAEVKNSADLTILYDFRSSTVANYIVELGDTYARFYADRGVLLQTDGSTPVEITTPWLTSELRELKFTQSADTLYVFHPDHETRKIQRTSATTFRIRKLGALNGPYQPRNTTGTRLLLSGLSGSVTIVAEDDSTNPSVIGLNDGAGFLPGDVGRQIRWIEASKETWLTITAVAPATSRTITGATREDPVKITVSAVHGYTNGDKVRIVNVGGMIEINDRTFDITVTSTTEFTLDDEDGRNHTEYTTGGTSRIANQAAATIDGPDVTVGQDNKKSWALGSFSDTSGWPRAGTFHQQRLWLGGTPEETQAVWGSETGIFNDFSPTEPDGTVLDSNGVTFTVDANLVMNVYDMKSHARGLIIMTDEAEVVATTSGGSFIPMTPSNKGARIQSTHGIRPNIRSILVDSTILFTQASGRKVWGMQFRFEDDQFKADDLTKLTENIGGDGFVDIAYQEEPNEILWLVRDDGQLVGLTYDPQEKVFAWHRHIIGGTLLGDDAVVESCAVIRDDPGDLLWLIVKRTIDGSQVRYVEYVGDRFDSSDNSEEAFFVDSGLASVDNPGAISAVTLSNPIEMVMEGGGLIGWPNGTVLAMRDIVGTTELNGNSYAIDSDVVTGGPGGTHTFNLTAIDGTSGFSAYVRDGTARVVLSSVSGLGHLTGEVVKVAGDGLQQADRTVSGGGTITLETPASIIYVGLASPYKLVTVPITPASAGFDTRTALMRVVHVNIMLNNSQSGNLGVFGGQLYPIEYPDTDLFTGIKEMGIEGAHDWRFQLELSSDGILPMNVLQLGLEVDIGS